MQTVHSYVPATVPTPCKSAKVEKRKNGKMAKLQNGKTEKWSKIGILAFGIWNSIRFKVPTYVEGDQHMLDIC